MTIPLTDYERLLELVELDDMLVTCEVCGAWLERDDPACATTEDFTGCWNVASRRDKDRDLCRSYRATVREQPKSAAGGPTVLEPDRPYCKPDQSCCDFACGN